MKGEAVCLLVKNPVQEWNLHQFEASLARPEVPFNEVRAIRDEALHSARIPVCQSQLNGVGSLGNNGLLQVVWGFLNVHNSLGCGC